MRILYLSQYFPPEVGATQTRAYEMARGLVQAGHQVTMLTELPNHPTGIVQPGFRRRLWVRRPQEGIEVLHGWVWASPHKHFFNRLAFYLSYMASATLMGLLLVRGRYDLIYCTSPPLFAGGAGLALRFLRRTPLVFEVRDLWPESAVEMGELNNRRAIQLSAWLANQCYRHSRHLIVVTEGIRQTLLNKGIPPTKITLIPNGANTDLFQAQPAAAATLRQQLQLQENFVVLYAGILGLAQGLETVLDAAALLSSHPRIQFLLVGAGPREQPLRDYTQNLGLTNVQFLGQQPREQMPIYLSLADLAVVPLRDVPVFHGALPSKLFDAWACQCPTLTSIRGEAQQLVEQAGAGRFVTPEDPAALAQAILTLSEQPEERQKMGERGREFVSRYYSRQAQASRLVSVLEGMRD
ncbi:MAG: glycosyltransferase family 4 protein [Anaerolineae bacterium]|nr:glycosyltransferase family 4 protein [Anaerolineae bacterium]